ncbi:DUF1642 domain-containing protein [Limosilactobacillus fermentum]
MNETKRDVFEVAMNHATKSGWVDYSEMMSRYDAALPEDLPVIPKAVSDYINDAKASHYELLDAMAKWTLDQPVFDWIHENSDAFARAWLDGYEVEVNEP